MALMEALFESIWIVRGLRPSMHWNRVPVFTDKGLPFNLETNEYIQLFNPHRHDNMNPLKDFFTFRIAAGEFRQLHRLCYLHFDHPVAEK